MGYSFDPRWDSPTPPMRPVNGQARDLISDLGTQLNILLSIDRRIGEVAGDVKVIHARQGQLVIDIAKTEKRVDKLEHKQGESKWTRQDYLMVGGALLWIGAAAFGKVTWTDSLASITQMITQIIGLR